MKNLAEFKKLIERYETVTLEEAVAWGDYKEEKRKER